MRKLISCAVGLNGGMKIQNFPKIKHSKTVGQLWLLTTQMPL